MRVLVVDDEPQIVRALRINLRARQFEVHTAASGTDALRLAARHPPDVVLLDLGLPDLDGVEVIEGLRGWTEAPIIVLSGRSDATDKVQALDAGADDYVTKPFGMDELLARMRAVTRRAQPPEAVPQVTLGAVTVDLAARRVTRPDNGTPADVRLTPTEWHLIEVLLRHPGKLLSQRQLLTEVWGPGYADAAGSLRLYMTCSPNPAWATATSQIPDHPGELAQHRGRAVRRGATMCQPLTSMVARADSAELTSAKSKAAGSKSSAELRPSHSRRSLCSSCAGSASSGGQALRPVRQRG